MKLHISFYPDSEECHKRLEKVRQAGRQAHTYVFNIVDSAGGK